MDRESCGGAANPMLPSLILSNIFNRLTVKTQKQFRLVNTIWEEASASQWRKSASIKIDMPYSTKKDPFSNLYWRGKGVEEFIKLWKGSSSSFDQNDDEVNNPHPHPHLFRNQPFRRFNLCWPEDRRATSEDELRTDSSLREFWKLCSPQMEYLQLSFFNSKECFIPTMKWLLLEGGRSALKELNLFVCSFRLWKAPRKIKTSKRKRNGDSEPVEPSGSGAGGPGARTTAEALTTLSMNLWYSDVSTREFQELFLITPNLKELSTEPYRISDYVVEALALNASTETITNKIKLEALHIEPMDVDTLGALLKYLKASKAELKSIALHFYFPRSIRRPPYHFHQILNSCSRYLKKIKIVYNGGGEDYPWIRDFNGRLFPQLTELDLYVCESSRSGNGNIGDEIKFDFKGLCGMPALKRFAFKKGWTVELRDKRYKTELSVEELSSDGGFIEWMGVDDVDEDLSSLRLDNLKKFELRTYRSLGVESLRMVAGWMKNLKKAKLVLNNETFPVLKEFWPNLEELTLVRNSKVDEEIILRDRIVNENGPIRIWIERFRRINAYDSEGSENESLFSLSPEEVEEDSDSDVWSDFM